MATSIANSAVPNEIAAWAWKAEVFLGVVGVSMPPLSARRPRPDIGTDTQVGVPTGCETSTREHSRGFSVLARRDRRREPAVRRARGPACGAAGQLGRP